MRKRIRNIIIIATAIVLSVAISFSAAAALIFSEIKIADFEQTEQTVEVFSEFTPQEGEGIISLFGISRKISLKAYGEVNTEKLGSYLLTYKAGFLFKTKKAQTKVTVVDTTPPTIQCDTVNIELEGGKESITAEEIKLDYTAKDNYDGNLTDKVQISVKDRVCYLTVSDSSGNKTIREINIIPDDDEYPTMLLSGTSTYYLHVGTEYKEPGYSAIDNMDGDITEIVQTTNNIDNTKAGEYRVQYTVSDKSGNTTRLSRKVVVYGDLNDESLKDIEPNGKVVYLTFDDGPGPYTEELLDTLDRYGVKATFFVTNQSAKYQHLIAEIDRRGHAIGVHTLTHKWSIYESEEKYYQDFNAMADIIKAQTGKTTNIFRFPGGTNNRISASKNKGIMTRLSKQMTEQGYYYFDWNVDCNDAKTTNQQNIIYDTLQQIESKSNAVVLMHDIKLQTVKATPAIIEECLKKGYTFKVLTSESPEVRFKPIN